ncbi:complement factor H-related protein 4-like [Enoplosus armatus]|uniref:complement factor H-related protein 4-like n=1 Tax=Enoplosus armatus TaxID=215367 RepID=UPI003996679F
MRITCDEGYEHKDHRATAKCIKGEWSRVLVCEKSIQACSEPPRIPHAVIIHQRYQEVFAVDSKLRYECEDGYTVEGAAESNKFITCTAGAWTEGPLCKEGGIGGGNTASAGKGPTTRPELYETETNPPITTGDCTVDTADHSELKPAGVKNIENGGSFRFECTDVWKFENFSDGQCTDGKMTFTRCCNRLQLGAGTC